MDRERAEIHLRRLIEAELRRGQPDFLLVRTVEDALVSTGTASAGAAVRSGAPASIAAVHECGR
jgi:hypothetical protein